MLVAINNGLELLNVVDYAYDYSKTASSFIFVAPKLVKTITPVASAVFGGVRFAIGTANILAHSEDNGIKRKLDATLTAHKTTPQPVSSSRGWPTGSGEPARKDGVPFTSEMGQGEAPHIKEEYRTNDNQQTESIDGLMILAELGGKIGNFKPGPGDFRDPWSWVNSGKTVGDAAISSANLANVSGPVKFQPPVKDTAPAEEGVYTEYITDESGFVQSGYTSGKADTTIPGKNGAPDTLRVRPINKPKSIPKKNIIPKK